MLSRITATFALRAPIHTYLNIMGSPQKILSHPRKDFFLPKRLYSSDASIKNSPSPAPKKKLHRILSIDGEGIESIISLRILAELERRTQQPISKLFDSIIGTSHGGVIALALNTPSSNQHSTPKFSAENLLQMYKTHASELFFPETFREYNSYNLKFFIFLAIFSVGLFMDLKEENLLPAKFPSLDSLSKICRETNYEKPLALSTVGLILGLSISPKLIVTGLGYLFILNGIASARPWLELGRESENLKSNILPKASFYTDEIIGHEWVEVPAGSEGVPTIRKRNIYKQQILSGDEALDLLHSRLPPFVARSFFFISTALLTLQAHRLKCFFMGKSGERALNKLLDTFFKDAQISSALKNVIVPSLDTQTGTSFLFSRNRAARDSKNNFTMKETGLAATASARLFKHPRYVNHDTTLNNPAMTGLAEVLQEKKGAISILSIGLNRRDHRSKAIFFSQVRENFSAKNYDRIRDECVAIATDQAEKTLKGNYCRLAPTLPDSTFLTNNDDEATKKLLSIAEKYIFDHTDVIDEICKKLRAIPKKEISFPEKSFIANSARRIKK